MSDAKLIGGDDCYIKSADNEVKVARRHAGYEAAFRVRMEDEDRVQLAYRHEGAGGSIGISRTDALRFLSEVLDAFPGPRSEPKWGTRFRVNWRVSEDFLDELGEALTATGMSRSEFIEVAVHQKIAEVQEGDHE